MILLRQIASRNTTKDFDDVDYSLEQVLVVDDEESVRQPLVEMLRILGFKVHEASNGSKALNLLEKESYSVLLTDMKMPELDGFELIEKACARWPEMCVIAMTGYTKGYSYVSVIRAGASDFINKPFGLEELEAKIKRAILERNVRRELSRLSVTDALTGLYNQRHFYDHLKKEILRSRRQRRVLSLILLDLDDFKAYNDNHGHLAGDALLQKVGGIIETSIRDGVDSGYRYGGDEFAVILIDADREVAEGISRRIAAAIEKECRVSASFGYATHSGDMTLEDLVNLADRHLYRFKGHKKIRSGRTGP